LALLIAFFTAVQIVQGATVGSRYQSLLELMVKEGVPLAIVAVGAGLVLCTGGVDLSSMGVATLSGVIFGSALQLGLGSFAALGIALLFGMISGFAVGAMVSRDVPSLISSWAVGSLWSIGAALISTERPFGLASSATGVALEIEKTWLDLWDEHGGHGVRYWLVALFVVIALLNNTYFARRCCAIGANRFSALYAGIRLRRTLMSAYIVAGTVSALAGVLWAVLGRAGSTTDQLGKELIPIAAAAIGGTVMSGGYFRPLSIVAAAFLWTVMDRGCNALHVEWLQGNQQRVINALFAIIILGIVLTVGRRLSGFTQTITTEPRAKETR
jgi:ribose/xylose/arabinose/galactoside ABC-type transport system permease subunit